MARRKNPQIHHVDFAKVNRRWVAYIYIDPNTTISQQTVGSKKNVDKIIKTQLEPQGIPYTIEGMAEMTNYPAYMVKAGLVPNSRHGSYPGDIGKIPKTKAAFQREYYNLLTEYFSTRQYIGAGKYEKPTAKSLRIADRLAELQDAHPDWAFETDDKWGDDQRLNPRRKKSNPRNRKLAIELPNTNLTVVGVGRDTNGNSVLRVKTPNQRAFSIQTLYMPLVHRLRSHLFSMAEIPSRDRKAFTSEVVDYIKYYGSPAQKKSLRVYKSNTKRRKKSNPHCKVNGCHNKVRSNGMCGKHNNPKRRRNSRVLWRRNKWRIEWYDPQAKWRGFYVVGENHAEHPTVYFDGSIAYDRPEAVPKYVQKAVAQLAQKYESQMDRYNNPRRRNSEVDAEILSTYARGRRAKFGASDDPMRFASGPFKPQFKRMRRNSKASRSNLVFFMETRGGKYNVKVYKVGKKYEMVVHERGQADLTAQTTSKAELSAIVGQFYRVGYMTGTAKYKVKHDALGLGIE